MRLQLLAGAAALALSTAAGAVDFDFTGSGRPADGNYTSINYTSGGIGVTITPTGNSTRAVSYWEGIGAYSSGADLGTFDDCCGVLNQDKDQLVFTFNRKVTITGMSFRQWENGFDQVRFIGGGYNFVLSNSGQSALIDYFTFGSPITLDSFTLQAINGSGTATYIHGLEGVTAAVPVPAAMWMMGSSLLGLAGLARRRKFA